MKQSKFKRLCMLLLALLLVFSFTGCSPKTTDTATSEGTTTTTTAPTVAEPTYADQIVIGRLGDASYLDPNQPVGVADITILDKVYEGLLTASEDAKEILPSLATDWTISDDGTVYTFNLRPNVKFSDGTPVTPEDWVWSFLRARDAETSSYRFVAAPIKDVKADDKTVTITINEPNASFLSSLVMFNLTVGSKKHFDAIGEEAYSLQPLGTGQYMLKEWKKEEYILLEKNPYYWDPTVPFTKELKYKVVNDDNTRTLQLQSGDIDIMMDVPFTMVSQLETDKNIKTYVFPSTQIRYLLLNTKIAPFDNPKVREALVMGIDKQELADIITLGYGKPAQSILSDTQAMWFNKDLKYHDYDAAGAKALLTEAGFPDGVNFTISVRSGSAVYEQIAVLLKSQLALAGFNVEIELLERASLSDKYQSLTHQATVLQWVDDFPDPVGIMGYGIDYAQSDAWYTALDDKELEALNAKASVELDVAKRQAMYNEIQQRVYDNYNIVSLFSNSFVWAANDRVENLKLSPFYVQTTTDLKMLVK